MRSCHAHSTLVTAAEWCWNTAAASPLQGTGWDRQFVAGSHARYGTVLAELAEVPYLEVAVVSPGHQQRLGSIPGYYVDVCRVGVGAEHACLVRPGPAVPNADCLVHRARGKYLQEQTCSC